MRLWFSVTALLILACVILEVSAAKSNRVRSDSTKDNYRSTNSKEVRYSKNNKNSDHKKKVNGRDQEVIKERKQRDKREKTQSTDSNESLKKDRNERGGKLSHEEQKNREANKQRKGKSHEDLKTEKNTFKGSKDSVKKNKRSLETEESQEKLIKDINGSEEPKINSALKKEKSKMKYNKKTGQLVEESIDAIVNTEQVSGDKPSEETTNSVNNNDSSSKKEKIGKNKQKNSKKMKRHVPVETEENRNSLKPDSIKEKVRTPDLSTGLEFENGEDFISTPENSYYLNEDGVIKEKKSGCVNGKKYKSSKKSSGTESECESRVSRCEISASDTSRHGKEKLGNYQSDVCNLEVKPSVKLEDRIDIKKSGNSADDNTKDGRLNLEEQKDEDGTSKSEEMKSVEEDEAQD